MREKIGLFLKRNNIFNRVKIIKDSVYRSKTYKENRRKRLEFYSSFVKQNDLCFDVGANYGNRTEVFLQIGAQVVAVEPQPMPADYLKKKFGNKIILEQKALGKENGVLPMYIESSSVLSSLSDQWISKVKSDRFSNSRWDKKIYVDVTTLDHLIKKYGVPDFCKIDVEGYELEVLEGLANPVKILSFEFTIPEFTDNGIKCINYLASLGKMTCNYSRGEEMKFELDEWISPDKFIILFKNLHLKGVVDGDIYIKFLN